MYLYKLIRVSIMYRVFFLNLFLLFSVSSNAETVVYGRVTGIDNKPISLAHVFLTYPSDNNPIRNIKVQRDGKYKIVVDSKGLWMLHFTGLFHHEYPVAIYIKNLKEIKLDVKLETYRYLTDFKRVKVIGNFNEWERYHGIGLKKDKDNTYSVVIESKSDTILYRLLNVRPDGEIEGTNADGYLPSGIDSKGIIGYNSFLINKKGKVKIIFDPGKLVQTNHSSVFKIFPSNSFEAKFAKAYSLLQDTKQKYKLELFTNLAKYNFKFKFDFNPSIDSVKSLLDKEHNNLIHQVYLLSYYNLKYLSGTGHYVDVNTSRQTLKGIPPGSVIWSLNPELISPIMNSGAFSEPGRKKYVYQVINSNPMERTKAVLLYDEIERKFHSLQYSSLILYLSILTDQYGDSPEAKMDKERYSRYILLKEGSTAPKFEVKSISDSTYNFTNDFFKNKFYLLNFWITSSPMAIEEIENLKKAYSEYRENGLNIISVSLDSSSEYVSKFIKNKTEIPWYNAFEERGLDSQLCKDFEVYSVPKSILINPDDKIIAIGWDLRGANLMKTLKNYFSK